MTDANQYCQEKAAPRGSDLYYSLLFLAPEKRRALAAFHALWRELDDIADDCRDAQVARLKLTWWVEEVDRLFAGTARHPVARALTPLAAAGAIEREEFREIIEGTAMNLEIIVYPDFKTLQFYCRRTAGMACQIMAQLLGGQERATIGYAQELGVALRLTRMIRDVGTDARRGRIYLPADELAQFGVAAADITCARASPAFHALMEHQYRRAEEHYTRALAALPRADRNVQRAGLALGAIYRALLREIRRDGFQILDRRYALTPLRKLWLAARVYAGALMP